MRQFSDFQCFLALLAISVLAHCAAAPAGALSTNRVVAQYTLTSANDFPQRDPQDWQLLGSNDGGKTWTVLDRRQGELFSERHERRTFTVIHPLAFNVYRLQIDRVREPAGADSVQLAEIEVVGPPGAGPEQDPSPMFADTVTAQAENGPWETRWQAFDGRAETKWLDHATNNPSTRSSWIQWQYALPANVLLTNFARLQELRRRAGAGYPVVVDAVVAGRSPSPPSLCLIDATGHLDVPLGSGTADLLPGEQVRLRGASDWTNSRPDIAQCALEKRGPAPAEHPKTIAPEQPVSLADDWQLAEAVGRLQFSTRTAGGLDFELQDEGRTIAVHVLHVAPAERLPAGASRVRATGILRVALNTRGEPVAGDLWVSSLAGVQPVGPWSNATNGVAAVPVPALPTGANLLLTNLAQVRRLTPDQLVRWPKVKVRGVITEMFGGYMQEDASGIEIWYANQLPENIPPFRQCVEIEGRGDWALGHGPIIRADRIEWLGAGKLPRAERCSWSQLASGRMADQWCELEAVVRATDGSHVLLACEGGQLMATVRSAAAVEIRNLVDATVLVRGVSVAATDSRGRVQGLQLVVPSLEYVEVEQAPVDPFTLPTRAIGSLLQVRAPTELNHRVKVEGTLTFREGRNYFVQDATGGAMAIAQEQVVLDTPAGGWSWVFWQSERTNATRYSDPAFSPGDHLQVVGFPEMRGYSPVLTEVLVRKMPHAGSVQPVKAGVTDMVAGRLDSTLVTTEALLLRDEVLGSHHVLELRAGERVFQALLPRDNGPHRTLQPGSRVRVTGVCQLDPAPYAELGQRVASFKLLVGSVDDVLLLKQPSWWTLQRALLVAGVLVVVLALAAAWIGILRRQVELRTRELQHEVAEHERTEQRLASEIEQRKRIEAEVEQSHKRLLTTSHFAGMAEVATSVLHNVGNVLNSANVLASVIVEQVHKSKVQSVSRLADLLKQQGQHLHQFLAEDNRGRDLPGYVERLGTHLAAEQGRLLEKSRALTESLQHIKEIIAMQQNYAKISGVQESVALTEVVEDALRMHQGALERHQVRVIRDFQQVPPVLIDRHKVLQILFNLLENAKYACDVSGQSQKVITVSVGRNGDQRFQVRVADNGVGIAPENLRRIFDQEFSTRAGGHGFGLHSSILAAQDLGATLTAHSDGPGQGALFVLELPGATAATQCEQQPVAKS